MRVDAVPEAAETGLTLASREIASILAAGDATSFDLPEVRAKFAQEGIEAERMDAATSARFMEEENARWGQS
jgi:uncharacterized protein